MGSESGAGEVLPKHALKHDNFFFFKKKKVKCETYFNVHPGDGQDKGTAIRRGGDRVVKLRHYILPLSAHRHDRMTR